MGRILALRRDLEAPRASQMATPRLTLYSSGGAAGGEARFRAGGKAH